MATKKTTKTKTKTTKKNSEDSLIYKIKKLPGGIKFLIVLAAVVLMVVPIVRDVIKDYDQSIEEQKIMDAGGYPIIIADDADLLTANEEEDLKSHMNPISQHGAVAFVTSTAKHSGNTSEYARKRYLELIGEKSGTLFLIDMGDRQLYIYSGNRILSTVTKSRADDITDNVYRLATRGQYYDCAAKVFDQIGSLLRGGTIPQYMKHISSALLSIAAALLIVFVIANYRTRMHRDQERHVFDETAEKECTVGKPANLVLLSEKKTRHVESSGGGGGGGGGFSGGGGGGGGFSGGGGGHGF